MKEQVSKQNELIPREKFIHGDSPAKIPNWRLVDSPERPDCVEIEEGIEIYTTKNNVKYVRTPEERFENLKDFPYEPHYAHVEDLRMHYIDEGSESGEVILLLHGQPSWSYLYRKMIPILAEAGYRVIAADNMGLGRSDKPIDIGFHTYEHHVAILKEFLAKLNLNNITLFCQDWGGLFGLRMVGEKPELFARVIAANTQLPVILKGMNPYLVPNPIKIDCSIKEIDFEQFASEQMSRRNRKIFFPPRQQKWFQRWIIYCLIHPNLKASQILQVATINNLSDDELAAYDAPYPSFVYKAAIRTLPSMVAAIEQNNEDAWKNLGEYNKPFLFLGGEEDLLLGTLGVQKTFTSHIPGTKGKAHERYPNAGHYIQDDIGVELAKKVISFIKANPV